MMESDFVFEQGDKVKVLHSWRREGDEGEILYAFCEYGDHRVCVQFEDGEKLELDEGNVEYLGPDKFEYSVQFHWGEYAGGDWETVSENDWTDKDHAERWLKSHEEGNQNRVDMGKPVFAVGRLVKRRKAGPLEPV